jgi:hypothetical protein
VRVKLSLILQSLAAMVVSHIFSESHKLNSEHNVGLARTSRFVCVRNGNIGKFMSTAHSNVFYRIVNVTGSNPGFGRTFLFVFVRRQTELGCKRTSCRFTKEIRQDAQCPVRPQSCYAFHHSNLKFRGQGHKLG